MVEHSPKILASEEKATTWCKHRYKKSTSQSQVTANEFYVNRATYFTESPLTSNRVCLPPTINVSPLCVTAGDFHQGTIQISPGTKLPAARTLFLGFI